MYKHVLGQYLPWLDDMVRAKRPVRLPVVLPPAEVDALLAQLRGVHWLMASLLYGAGLRLMECLRLRVKDIDFLIRRRIDFDARSKLRSRTNRPWLQAQFHYSLSKSAGSRHAAHCAIPSRLNSSQPAISPRGYSRS